MAEEDRERWDDRYASAPEAVESSAPERIGAVLDRIPATGRALDVACGLGAQSLWAAERGLHVTALDISPTATSRVAAAADRAGLADRVEVRTHDLDGGLPGDLPGPFDLVIVQRFRAPNLSPELVRCLAPDGVLIVSVLSEVGHAGEPGPHHAIAGELEQAFVDTPLGADLEMLASDEADGLATIVLRRRATLLHPMVAAAVERLGVVAEVVPCDPDAADTAVFCETYGYELDDSANTIVVVGKGADPVHAACVVLASTKLSVNSVVRKRLGTKKASFAPGETTRELTDMEIGGVTAVGLPADLPLWVDAAVMSRHRIILGGGNRSSKLVLAPAELLKVPGAEIVPDLAVAAG